MSKSLNWVVEVIQSFSVLLSEIEIKFHTESFHDFEDVAVIHESP